MAREQHHAILVAINRYPGISDLQGPENDALAFRDWLLDAAGGDVPAAQVRMVRSSDFPTEPSADPRADPRTDPHTAPDPYAAHPTELEFKRLLDGLVREADRSFKQRAGERLYLYFAGHGFTAGTLDNPALFTAQAQIGDNACIAAQQYAQLVANAGFFDEIVLVLDCCQDVLKASTVQPPSWQPPDRGASGRVKLLVACAAQRGRKAFEGADAAHDGTVRGHFSSLWIDALRSAPGNAAGWVTGAAIKEWLFDAWEQRHPDLSLDDGPAVSLPKGPDIKLLARAAPGSGFGDRFGDRPGDPLEASDTAAPELAAEESAPAPRSPQPPASSRPARAPRAPPGAAPFPSPAPLPGSSTTHEYQQGPSVWLIDTAPRHAADQSSLLVIARCSADRHRFAWPPRDFALRLRRVSPLGGQVSLVADAAVQRLDGERIGFISHAAAAGQYLVGVQRKQVTQMYWEELPVTVVPGRCTLVFIDTIDDANDSSAGDGNNGAARVLDLSSASVLVAPVGQGQWLRSDAAHATEVLRLALRRGQGEMPQGMDSAPDSTLDAWAASSPLLPLYRALVLADREDAPWPQVAALCEQATQGWTAANADVEVLAEFVARCLGGGGFGGRRESFPLDRLPMLHRTWQRAERIKMPAVLSPSVVDRFGQWRQGSPLWGLLQFHVALGDDAPGFAPRVDFRMSDSIGDDSRAMRRALVRALNRVDPQHSPLQQALRRRLMEDEEEDLAVDDNNLLRSLHQRLGGELGALMQAYEDLQRQAFAE